MDDFVHLRDDLINAAVAHTRHSTPLTFRQRHPTSGLARVTSQVREHDDDVVADVA